MIEVFYAERMLMTGRIKLDIIFDMKMRQMLWLQDLRNFLRVSARRRNMQRHCGGCLQKKMR